MERTLAASTVTRLLREAAEGDACSLEELAPRIYDRLRRLAAVQLRGERGDHTLQPTALANEAWMRLVPQVEGGLTDRVHFFAVASRALRHILVDHARRRAARGIGSKLAPEQIDEMAAEHVPPPSIDVLALHEALEEFERLDPDIARLIDLRYFGGLTIQETAMALGVAPATIKRQWSFARAWLYRRLGTAEAT